jgi:phage shock protein C
LWREGYRVKKFYLSDKEKKIAGVCGGFAEYFDIDVTFVRLLFVIGALFGGLTILIYIILWIVAPKQPKDKKESV